MPTTDDEANQLVQPTVLGAMRRHWMVVSLIVVASLDVALTYGVLKGEEFRATATVSAPRPAGSALQSDQQYLDSQVLLLNSRQVGDRAFQIVGTTPAGEGIDREDLAPSVGDVEIIPPGADSSGSYGTTVVTINFTAPSPEEAQVGVNALATAYGEVRSEEIADHATDRLAGISQAIAAADSLDDVASLRSERAQALIDQGRDLSQPASISTAEKPEEPPFSSLAGLLAVGLCFGIMVGGAAAYIRASRLQHVGKAHVALSVYDAPLLFERQPADRSADTVELTEPSRLLGRVVAHRLRTVPAPAVIAVVATPGNRDRTMIAANLALALTEGETPVLAVDGDDGTMAAMLCPGPSVAQAERAAGGAAVASPLHGALSVLDLSPAWAGKDLCIPNTQDRVVVVDCPPMATSARAVDLLSRCDAVLVLVRADEPVREHVEVARWLELTGTVVLGYVFTPYVRRGPRYWWTRRRASALVRRPKVTSPEPVQESRAPLVPEGAHRSPAPHESKGPRVPVDDRA